MSSVVPNKTETTYTFASQPRAVPQRKKYRDNFIKPNEEEVIHYGNIMYDPRVFRGSTFAHQTLPISAQPDPIEIQRKQEAKRRAVAKNRARQQLKPKTPDPVEGRKNINVQTELYLEEISDRTEEADADCQTDNFLERPPSPAFIPAKTGIDIATQIADGDLFDFDVEVKPVLEVLVGKTVEQALLEVMQEEELAALRSQQREFEELRNTELVEQQRLEEQERRLREEKERRLQQQLELMEKERETAEKLAAHVFSHGFLSDLVPSVYATLADNGYFFDPVERDIEEGFMPWLLEMVDDRLRHVVLGRTVLDSVIRDVVTKRHLDYKAMEERVRAESELKVKSDELPADSDIVTADSDIKPSDLQADGEAEDGIQLTVTETPGGLATTLEEEDEGDEGDEAD